MEPVVPTADYAEPARLSHVYRQQNQPRVAWAEPKLRLLSGAVLNVNARRALTMINPLYGPQLAGGLTSAFSLGDGAYNGLLLALEQRMAHGFSVLTNYTWSHYLDDGEIGQDITNGFENPANPKANWGNCGYNRKGIFNLSVTGQTGQYSNRAMRMFVGGWSGSGVFTAATGSNYNLTDNFDYSLTGVGLDRPNLVGNPNQPGPVSEIRPALRPRRSTPCATGSTPAPLHHKGWEPSAAS